MQVLAPEEYAMTLDDVGLELGLGTRTVGRIQTQAMEKIRLYCALRGIQFNDVIDSLSKMKGTK
jgi:DNA-directed RNA polymerase sigma subunit (sigma70/sigma32)